MIEFTIKTLDSTNHPFSVEDETTVEQLKEKVREQMGIEPGLQRLIFCGRVLQDENKLSDYDVHGKVVHLVQRAPPGPESRSSSGTRQPRGNRSFNSTANGPSEDGENLPFHQEMRRLINMAATPDFMMDTPNPITQTPTAGRMETARRLIAEIKATLGCLRAHLANEGVSGAAPNAEASAEPMETEPPPAPSNEEREPQFDESGEEIVGDPAARPQSARRRVARRMRTRHTQPRHLAQMIDELDELNEQFAPHRALYTRMLREANDPQAPSYTNEERLHHQSTVEMVTDLMHSFSHAYHALSDIMFTVGSPRLSAEAAVTRHLIPMQAHINVISAAPVTRRGQGTNSATGGTNAGGATATQTSATATATAPDANAQPNRGNAPGRNTTQPTVNISIQPDPVTYQLEIETRVPISVAPFDNIFLSGLRNNRSQEDAQTQNQSRTQENQSDRSQSAPQAQAGQQSENQNAQQNPNGQQNQNGQQDQGNRRQMLRDLENLFRGMGPSGLGGVEVVMSMEEIPSVALGNLGNLTSGNGGLNSFTTPAAGQQAQDGGVYFAPMAAFASGGPPDANMLQTILQHLIRQGLVPGLNEGVTLQPSQIPQQFHQFLNIPQNANQTNQSTSDANPASPGPPTTNAETQTNVQGVDSVLVASDDTLDDEDEEPAERTLRDSSQNRDNGSQTPGQGRASGQGRVSGPGHVLGQGLAQGQMLAQGHVLAQGQALGRGQISGNISGQVPPVAVIGNNQIYGPPQDPFSLTHGSQGSVVPGPARVQALARAQAQAQVQAMAQAQVQAQQAQAQAQSQGSGETSAPGTQNAQSQGQTPAQSSGQGQTQASGQPGQQGSNNDTQRQPNLHMRRAAFGNARQALALSNMFYDRYLQCESPHARRRLQRRRNQQQQMIEQRDQVRSERSSQQNIESLCLRRSQIRPAHMCTIMTLLNGESSPQAYLNAFMVAVSRQLYMSDLLYGSNGMPALVPHEFQSLRMLVRNYVNDLITAAGTSESDHAFQGVADFLVGQYAGFIADMGNNTTMHPDIDPYESIRAFVRSRLPAFIASVMCDSNNNMFVARFYSMMLRLLSDVSALVYHMCLEGEAGVRRLYKLFLDVLTEGFDEQSREAVLALGHDNISGVMQDLPAQVDNILQYVRRVDGVMPDLPSRDGEEESAMDVTLVPQEPPAASSPPSPAPVRAPLSPQVPLDAIPRHLLGNRRTSTPKATAGSSSSDPSPDSSPILPLPVSPARVTVETDNARGSPTADADMNLTPPVILLQHWGEEWVPVFTRDQQSQNSPQQRQVEPYSDGYLTGMPSRKRRCVRQARPPTTLDGFMNESVNEATERTVTDNGAIRTAFREHMRGLARARATSSDDFDPLRHASAARFLQPRPNKNDKPESSDQENGV